MKLKEVLDLMQLWSSTTCVEIKVGFLTRYTLSESNISLLKRNYGNYLIDTIVTDENMVKIILK